MEMSFKTSDDKDRFIVDCKQKCGGDTNFIKYKGCYMDENTEEEDRDLPKYIGLNLDIDTCFLEAKKANLKYLGLQNGNECWGGNTYGAKGKAPEAECSLECYTTSGFKCGNAWRNSIYEVGNYKDT